MKKIVAIISCFIIILSCTKTENKQSTTPPVVNKLSSCDSIKQGLLKTANDTIRLVSCVSITGCDSLRLGILKPNKQDTLRLSSCIKISGCDSLRLGILKPNKQDTLRLLSCIKISGCDSLKFGLIKTSQDSSRLGCDIITIGSQKWMKENLNVVTYQNGDTIPQITDPLEWERTTKGAWCYYENNSANGNIYGKLYNYYAVKDPRGLAPKGFHIPNYSEWETLESTLGGQDVAGHKLKTSGVLYWQPANNSTNESGFSGLPGGSRQNNGNFGFIGNYGYWWTLGGYQISGAWYKILWWGSGLFNGNYGNEKDGRSVRCIKD